MSEVIALPEAFAQRLEAVLREGLKKVGIEGEVEIEPVPGTLLHRALVISPQFEAMGHMDRQDFIWRLVDRHFSRDEQLYISTIWTMTPDEMDGN